MSYRTQKTDFSQAVLDDSSSGNLPNQLAHAVLPAGL